MLSKIPGDFHYSILRMRMGSFITLDSQNNFGTAAFHEDA